MNENKIGKIVYGFIIGVISHGVLDYVPHCYPISSKLDLLIGLIIILICLFKVKKDYKFLVSAVLFGCVFPDVIDLTPAILNSQLGINLPIFENIFPWHIHEYSGSIYTEECSVSKINHILTLLFSGIIIILNKRSVMKIIK